MRFRRAAASGFSKAAAICDNLAKRQMLLRLTSGYSGFVAQPPLPLQVFLPLHPWSPDLQPPWPLHVFFPLQS